MKTRICISVDPEVVDRIEELREGREHFASHYINEILRSSFKLPKKSKKVKGNAAT